MNGRTNSKKWLVILVCLPTIWCMAAAGRTIYVDDDGPADFNNIQAAIDAATDGDAVFVNDGTYVENLGWPQTDNIAMVSINGPEVTIIDGGSDTESSIYVGNGQKGVIIDGFTIKNGYGTVPTFHGSIPNGGGILIDENVSATITNCIITENGNSSVTYGAGVFVSRFSNVVIENCEIFGNQAKEIGAVYYRNFTSDGVMKNCLIYNNSSINGAVFCQHSPVEVCNNTISNNIGNGMVFYYPWPKLKNNIISSNSGYAIQANDPDNTYLIAYNDIWGNSAGDYIHFWAPWHDNIYIVGQYGNISADPCFVDPNNGDYRLRPDSPCIDAGDPNYVAEPNETDLDGKPRVIDCRIDMGAYEYGQFVPAEVRIVPRTINLASKGKWIRCYIWLGEEYDVADIDPNSVLLEGEVQAESLKLDEEQQVAMAKFSRSDVQEILNTGEVELTITGELTDGIVFEGTDVIRVIDKGKKK